VKFLYLRHGKTEYSLKNQFMGRYNLPLLSTDHDEFKESISLIKEWKPTKIYYSPLLRAIETKNIILNKVDISKAIECEDLIERDFGSLEGKEKNETNRKKIELCSLAESKTQFRERISKFLTMIETEIDESILVVGHSSFFREMMDVISTSSSVSINCCEAKVVELNV